MAHQTREGWLENAANYLYTDFIGELAHMGKGESWQVSCGWPSSRALSASRRRTGECWGPEACKDKTTHHIFVSPVLDEPVEVLGTLIHELIHAICGADAGHRGPFKRLALAVGLEGKMTATVAGKELTERLNALSARLGPYPHQSLSATNRSKQATRLRRVICNNCGYTCRIAASWIAIGTPTCPCGERMTA